MLGNSPFYNQTIRKTITAFGQLFSDIRIKRVDSNKKKTQVIKVPFAYGPKEKWLRRIQENPDLNKQVKMDLPRISFELNNYTYDSARKVGPNTNYLHDNENKKISTPIPWNFDISMYIATRSLDDMYNITEQIVPFFSPAVNVSVMMMEDPLLVLDIPVILNSLNQQDNWDESFEESRLAVTTLSFTMKGYMFSPVTTPKIIKRAIAEVSQRQNMMQNPSSLDSTIIHELNPFAETNIVDDPHIVDSFYINW